MAARNDYADYIDASQEIIDRHITAVGTQHNIAPQHSQNIVMLHRDLIEDTRSTTTTFTLPAASRVYSIAKRITDLTAAAILLILVLPVIAIIALTIKATSPGAVIFRQIRVG